MGDFRWLHFSDLHLETKLPNCDSGTARDELIHTLKKEDFGKREELYVFITGDIANKAGYTDEQDKWIEDFKAALGVPQDRIFWAPGNHDIKRDDISKIIIANLRNSKTSNLDELRNKTSDKKGDGMYDWLAVNRMKDYQEKYKIFFGRELTEEDLKRIHQFYKLEDFNLLVLNTSISSIDDNDQGKLMLKSEELRKEIKKGGEDSTDTPFFVIGHHGLDFLRIEDKGFVEQRFASENVDLYLCGHAHRPEIREATSARPGIKQITCGGGTPNYESYLTFFYGKYDSIQKGIHLAPYIYNFNTKWKKIYNVIDTLEENNFFPFSRLSKCTNIPSKQEKKQKDKPTPYIAWNMDRLAWRMPEQWDPNNDTVVPLDDRNALSLPALLLGNREGHITLLATTVPRGIAALLQQREQKYADKYKEWKERNWCECEGTEFVDGEAGDNAGLVICVKAEQLIKESLWEVIRRWRDGRPQRAAIVNVWSESPYYAARCAQLAYQYIRNAGASARAFIAAELGEERALKSEEIKELNQRVDAFEEMQWHSDECENNEVRELQIYRDECPDKWIALLKRHAKRRRFPGWICGFRASYQIHEYVSQWLAAADVDKFMREGELNPYISRLKEEEMDTLLWEVFRLWEKQPFGRKKDLLKELQDKLLEMGSESIRMLIRMWDSEDEAANFWRLEYPEVARWGRASDGEHLARALEYACEDKTRSWILIMSSPNAMDAVAERLMDPCLKRETELLLSQDVDPETDLDLYEEICAIRQEIYREIYTEEEFDL